MTTLRGCLVTTSQPRYPFDIALEKMIHHYERESDLKAHPSWRRDVTANHPILTIADSGNNHSADILTFEKSELLIPTTEGRMPVWIANLVSLLPYFEQVAIVGNEEKQKVLKKLRPLIKELFPLPRFVPEQGSIFQNLRAGVSTLEHSLGDEPFLVVTSDLPYIAPLSVKGMQERIDASWSGRRVLHLFNNTLANGIRSGWPRSYTPLGLPIISPSGVRGKRSPAKEANAYVVAPRLFRETRWGQVVERCYQHRKLFQTHYGQLLTELLPLLPTAIRALVTGGVRMEGHAYHELIKDIDSWEDLVLFHHQSAKNPLGADFTEKQRTLLARFAAAFRSSDFTKGTIYERYDARLAQHLRALGLPQHLNIGLKKVKQYDTALLYTS